MGKGVDGLGGALLSGWRVNSALMGSRECLYSVAGKGRRG